MERLTYRRPRFNNPVSNGACEKIKCSAKCDSCKINDLITKLCAYEDTGLEPEEIYEVRFLIAAQRDPQKLARLRELVLADQDGRLVVLPCKAGSLIYVGRKPAIITRFFGYVRERYFHAVFCDENKGIDIPFEELGKTVFLTREEAEAVLAQKGGKDNA